MWLLFIALCTGGGLLPRRMETSFFLRTHLAEQWWLQYCNSLLPCWVLFLDTEFKPQIHSFSAYYEEKHYHLFYGTLNHISYHIYLIHNCCSIYYPSTCRAETIFTTSSFSEILKSTILILGLNKNPRSRYFPQNAGSELFLLANWKCLIQRFNLDNVEKAVVLSKS